MKNILVVCADKDFRKDVAKLLASKINCIYLDVNDLLELEILNSGDVGLSHYQEALHEMEKRAIKRALAYKNCIISVSHDVFVANDNFRLLANLNKIYIRISKGYLIAKTKKDDKYKLEQELCLFDEIDGLIKDVCDISIDQDIKSVNDICDEIISYLKQKKSH